MKTIARIRTAKSLQAHGMTTSAQTFYVSSLTQRGGEYTIKRFRRTAGPNLAPTVITCNCHDYSHRAQIAGLACKHIHLVVMFAKAVGGWSKVKLGMDVQFGFEVQS